MEPDIPLRSGTLRKQMTSDYPNRSQPNEQVCKAQLAASRDERRPNTGVNTDGHQSSKTSGRAHAPNGPDPLRQLFACPWNSSSGGPATVSDAEQDRLP